MSKKFDVLAFDKKLFETLFLGKKKRSLMDLLKNRIQELDENIYLKTNAIELYSMYLLENFV